MPNFSGTLSSNEIFGALFNMIISQQVYADNISGVSAGLVDQARVDGSLYGDTKLYYSTDALEVEDWGNDAEAANLLVLHRPAAPQCQAIKINKFKQIRLTVDNYLSKRAWMNEGAFGSFTSVMLAWLGDTKRVYDAKTYNAFFGTAMTTTGEQDQTIDLPTILTGLTGEEKSRVEAQAIAERIANIKDDMTLDATTDFNDYQQLRSYDPGKIKVIFSSKWANKITYMDLPTIFHNDNLSKFVMVLPSKFFGTINATAKAGDGSTVRSLIEQKIATSGVTTHYRPGDLIKTTDTAPAGTSYTEDGDIICKMVTELPPYMSAFSVGTSFWNPRSLTETHYLTFGHNTLEYLKGKPLVTLKSA